MNFWQNLWNNEKTAILWSMGKEISNFQKKFLFVVAITFHSFIMEVPIIYNIIASFISI